MDQPNMSHLNAHPSPEDYFCMDPVYPCLSAPHSFLGCAPAIAMEDVQMEVPQMAIPTIPEIPMIQLHPDPDAMDVTYDTEEQYSTIIPRTPIPKALSVAMPDLLMSSEMPAMDWDYTETPLPLVLRNNFGNALHVPAERRSTTLASSVSTVSRGPSSASESQKRPVKRVQMSLGDLPTELILMILLKLRDLYREDEDCLNACSHGKWHSLRLVHSSWNKLFKQYKALWIAIDLSLDWDPSAQATDEDPKLAKIARWKHRVDTHLNLTTGPDNNLPLTFYLVSQAGGLERFVLDYIEQHFDRVDELQMSTHYGTLSYFLRGLVYPAPALRALTLNARSDPDSFNADYLHGDVQDISVVINAPLDILAGHAPRLETAIFRGCTVPWDSPILRNGLRLLSVQFPSLSHRQRVERECFSVKPGDYLPTPQQLLGIPSSACSSMRYLNLLRALPLGDRSPTQAINLPALQALQIADLTIDCLALLKSLNLPHTTAVTVYCYGGRIFVASLAKYLALHSACNDDVSVQVDISSTSEASWLRTSKRGKDCETDFRPHVELQTPFLSRENKRPDILSSFFSTLTSCSNTLRALFLVDTLASTARPGRGYFKAQSLLKDYGHPRMDGITDVIYESGEPQTVLRFLRMERKCPSDCPPSDDAIRTVPLPNVKVLTIKLRVSQESQYLLCGEIRATVADRQQRGAPLEKIVLKNCEWIERDPDLQWIHTLEAYMEQLDWHLTWHGDRVSPMLELCARLA